MYICHKYCFSKDELDEKYQNFSSFFSCFFVKYKKNITFAGVKSLRK
jgi:hypothetical protein